MNNIDKAINKIEKYSVLDSKLLSEIREKMIDKAYKDKNFADLVNIFNMNEDTFYIGDMEYGVDYEIETYTKYSELLLCNFATEEAYNEAIAKYKKEYPDEDYDDELEEEWDDMETEYDEIYYNYVYRYNNLDADNDNATLSGLGVLVENKTGDTYLFLKGCGMDMSYTIMTYLIREYDALPEEFSSNSKIDWLKINTSRETFIELMVMAGLDEERLIEALK